MTDIFIDVRLKLSTAKSFAGENIRVFFYIFQCSKRFLDCQAFRFTLTVCNSLNDNAESFFGYPRRRYESLRRRIAILQAPLSVCTSDQSPSLIPFPESTPDLKLLSLPKKELEYHYVY